MRATIWGCRGSVPTPGPETVRYGGNTSCVEVRLADGTLVILDAGTGIRPLGLGLERDGHAGAIHLLLTHLHFDHLEGLRFFAPLWSPAAELHVWGPPSPLWSLRDRIARSFSPPLFPLELAAVPARIMFHDAPDEPWHIGTARVLAEPVVHPGPTLGYRLEEDGRALAYIPDHEPALTGDVRSAAPEWTSGFVLADEADCLLHDAQYTEEEYRRKVGWGHSSVADAVAFAEAAGARRLVMFHHDPLHSDGELESLLERANGLSGNGAVRAVLAFEGMTIEL